MEVMDGRYSQERESTECNMFNLVMDGLPGQVQDRIRQMTFPRTSTRTEGPSQPPAPQPSTTARANGRDKTSGSRASAARDPSCGPDRQSVGVAVSNGRKGLISKVTSMAATMRPPSPAPDAAVSRSNDEGSNQNSTSTREVTPHHVDPHTDSQADSDRLTYINHVLHILRGLPGDLEPREIAMLHRAMPPAIWTIPAPGGGLPGQPGANKSANDRNMVHVLVLFCLCWLYSSAEWVMPKVAVYGRRIIRAEHEHGYIPRFMLAASRLLHAFVEAFRWLGDCWPCQILAVLFGYAMNGIRGALLEFTDRSFAREVSVGKAKEVVNGWM